MAPDAQAKLGIDDHVVALDLEVVSEEDIDSRPSSVSPAVRLRLRDRPADEPP